MNELEVEPPKPKSSLRGRFLNRIWKRLPFMAIAIAILGVLRFTFVLVSSAPEESIGSRLLYATPWLLISAGAVALFVWRKKQTEIPKRKPVSDELIEPKRKGRWVLWALGIRTPGADAIYGEKLANYRKWSSIPVAAMSIAVFVLIIGKIYFAVQAITAVMSTFNEETVVAQYLSGISEADIIADFLSRLAESVLHASPLWLMIPLVTFWLLAFVVDFIVAAVLAEPKGLWWRRHWGGIITAIVTLP